MSTILFRIVTKGRIRGESTERAGKRRAEAGEFVNLLLIFVLYGCKKRKNILLYWYMIKMSVKCALPMLGSAFSDCGSKYRT